MFPFDNVIIYKVNSVRKNTEWVSQWWVIRIFRIKCLIDQMLCWYLHTQWYCKVENTYRNYMTFTRMQIQWVAGWFSQWLLARIAYIHKEVSHCYAVTEISNIPPWRLFRWFSIRYDDNELSPCLLLLKDLPRDRCHYLHNCWSIMPGKVWGEITYLFLNFNGCTVEV